MLVYCCTDGIRAVCSLQCAEFNNTLNLLITAAILPFNLPGMLPVHPARAAARHRPSAGCSGKGKGGSRRAGGPAVTAAAPLAAAQQFATSPDGGQGRAVRGGG